MVPPQSYGSELAEFTPALFFRQQFFRKQRLNDFKTFGKSFMNG
jgi:hypothetical protein